MDPVQLPVLNVAVTALLIALLRQCTSELTRISIRLVCEVVARGCIETGERAMRKTGNGGGGVE